MRSTFVVSVKYVYMVYKVIKYVATFVIKSYNVFFKYIMGHFIVDDDFMTVLFLCWCVSKHDTAKSQNHDSVV